MSSIFHVPPKQSDPFPSEQFVELIDALIDRVSQTHDMGISMCSLMDLLVNEHKQMLTKLIIKATSESSADEAMFLITNGVHSLCHFVFEAGRQFQIELSNSLDDIDFDHLLDSNENGES